MDGCVVCVDVVLLGGCVDVFDCFGRRRLGRCRFGFSFAFGWCGCGLSAVWRSCLKLDNLIFSKFFLDRVLRAIGVLEIDGEMVGGRTRCWGA